MAWDETGKPCKGELDLGLDEFKIEIYKNYAVINIGGTILTFEFGEIGHSTKSGNIYIYGQRGLQNSIYLAAIYRGFAGDKKCLFGIGAYGFEKEEWVGIQTKTEKVFLLWLNSLNIADIQGILLEQGCRYNQGDSFFHKELDTPLQPSKSGEAKKSVFEVLLEGGKLSKDA
jgi:hypothetical protein